MFFFRKIGKLLLGKASAFQILVAACCGAVLGFVPGIFLGGARGGLAAAPGLVFALLAIVLVLRTNLVVFGLSFLVAKLVAIPLLPLAFEVGRFLLDGPLRGVFAWLVNAKVFAWFGLERYATSGGIVLGLAFGAVLGFVVLRGLRLIQRKMAAVEDREGYQKWSSKLWVRGLSWALLGVGPKPGAFEKAVDEQKGGFPLRIAGVVVVVALGLGLFLAQSFFAGPTLRQLTRSGLESWNGATVDLAEAGLDLAGGRVTIGGLAMADPQALYRDAFRARSLDVALDTGDLLRRRFVLADITSKEAWSGAVRDEPGVLIGKESPEPAPPPPTGAEKSLEDYIKEAQVWKERLQTVSRVLQKLVGGDGSATADGAVPSAEELAERARLEGLASVTAEHLLRGSPRVLLRKLALEGLRFVGFDTEVFDVHASNLSSQPSLVDEALKVAVTSRSGALSFSFEADPKTSKSAATRFVWKGLSIDALREQIFELPLRGGTLDLVFDGKLDFSKPASTWIEVPLAITLRGTTLELPGMDTVKLDALEVPLGLRGPLSAPRIDVQTKAFVDALVAAGKAEAAARVRAHVERLVPAGLGGLGKGAADLIEGKKTPAELAAEAAEAAKQRALEEAKKRAQQELEKILPGGLPGGLFGGKKKDS